MEESVLAEEELALGGVFGGDDNGGSPLVGARVYAGGGATDASACLADLSGMRVLVIRGERAADLIGACFAGPALAVGEWSHQPAFMGDGALASVARVARTGHDEFMVLDTSPRARLLAPWVSFLAKVDQGGCRPYGGVTVEDATDGLVPLLVWGQDAGKVLADYVKGDGALPQDGHLASLALDGRIPALIARGVMDGTDALLVQVQPSQARLLWRSLLSFQELAPVGTDGVRDLLRTSLPWYVALESPERLVPTKGTLRRWGIVRRQGDFVGARALGW